MKMFGGSSPKLILIEQGMSSIINFLIPVFVVRLDGELSAAVYFLVFSFVSIQLTIFRGLLSTPIPYFEKIGHVDGYRRYVLIMAVFLVICFLLSAYIYLFRSNQITRVDNVAPFIWLAVFLYLRESIRALSLALGKYWFCSILTGITFVSICSLAVGIFVRPDNFSGSFVSQLGYVNSLLFFALAIASSISLRSFKFSASPKAKISLCSLRRVFNSHITYGKFSTVNNFLQTVLVFFVYTILEKSNPVLVAIFGSILSLVNLASPVYQALNTYLARFFVSQIDNPTLLKASYLTCNKILFAFGFTYLVFIGLFGQSLFSLVYNFDFFVGHLIFFLVAIGFVLQGFGYPVSRLMSAAGQPKFVLISGGIYAAVMLVCIAVLHAHLDLVSASLSILLSRLAATIFLISVAVRFFSSRDIL